MVKCIWRRRPNKKNDQEWVVSHCHDAQPWQISFSSSQKPRCRSTKTKGCGVRWNQLIPMTKKHTAKRTACTTQTAQQFVASRRTRAELVECSNSEMLGELERAENKVRWLWRTRVWAYLHVFSQCNAKARCGFLTAESCAAVQWAYFV